MSTGRLNLHAELVGVLGSTNVYFNPPSSINLSYPCIIYRLSNIRTRHANNKPYSLVDIYSITVIDKNPESTFPKAIANMEGCRFDRSFVADNLHHTVFTLHY